MGFSPSPSANLPGSCYRRFNPSVGILWGLAFWRLHPWLAYLSRFNPSVGILWGLASPSVAPASGKPQFQSLGRDSVGFSPRHLPAHHYHRGQFQSLGRDSVGFSLRLSQSLRCRAHRFNPSVGILWGLAECIKHVLQHAIYVSIPRSGFCGV